MECDKVKNALLWKLMPVILFIYKFTGRKQDLNYNP